MEKLVVFNDFANVNAAYRQQGLEPDYGDLLDYLSEGRFLVEAHAFVPIDPRNPHARDHVIEALWEHGYLVHAKTGALIEDGYRCDFDVEITLELMRTAELVKPDIVVVISGDKDFVPVLVELRRRGIRVEIAAFPGVNAARELILKASGFIDLHRYLEERAECDATGGEPAQDGFAQADETVGDEEIAADEPPPSNEPRRPFPPRGAQPPQPSAGQVGKIPMPAAFFQRD